MDLRQAIGGGLDFAAAALNHLTAICRTYHRTLRDAYATWSATAFSSSWYGTIVVYLLVG